MLRNWAGNVRFGAARFHQPGSVGELRRLVAGSGKIKAVGSAHSFSRVADTTGDLVSLARLPKLVTVDASMAQVSVSAGVTYGELASELNRAGYALANLGSLPHISVAGAVMTGTHGSGDSNGCLATAVAAIELITAEGDTVTLRRDIGQSEFDGAVVALGALGVVVRLWLDIEPAYAIRQFVYDDLQLAELDSHFGEIFASGYSVSLFTRWRSPVISQAWLKKRAGGRSEPDPQERWLGARLASQPRHPLGLDPGHCTPALGTPGPWHERLPHFRLDFTPSAGHELQSEYLLPRGHALAAIRAVAAIGHRVAPVLQVAEIRTVAADELWLSPCYRRDTVALHFTWIDDPAAIRPVLGLVEEWLAPFGPRPHWGKLFAAGSAAIAGQYERLPDFSALMRHYDPAGKFRNAFLDTYFPG